MSLSDLLYNFTEWLRGTWLTEFALSISDTSLSFWIVTNFWSIPIFQTIHILSIAAAFSATFMFSLRIFGIAGGSRTIAQNSRRYLPWAWWGLLFLAISGILMIIGEPVRELINPWFWIKMVAIVVLIVLSIWFQTRTIRSAAAAPSPWVASSAVKGGAIALLILWCFVIYCGRFIAYAPV